MESPEGGMCFHEKPQLEQRWEMLLQTLLPASSMKTVTER